MRFTKTGEHRYGVWFDRDEASDLHLHPAPGYVDWVPNDMVYFLVEGENGLQDGIFGQLAVGGDAHTFVPTDERRTRRWARRSKRRNAATARDIDRSSSLPTRRTTSGTSAQDDTGHAWRASRGR